MRGLGPYVTLTNGKRRYARLDQGSGAVSGLTTVGSSGPATLDGFGNLNIPNYSTGGGTVPTSLPLASQLGILDNGTDQTSALNTIFSNAAYAGIVIDFTNPGAVTINGSVNAQGKEIRFVSGSRFTGTGSLNNFIPDAGLRQWCFDIGSSGVPVLTVNFVGSTQPYVSPWWFGAKDDGSDCARPFQAVTDCCIRNEGKTSKVYLPEGTYVSSAPVNQFSWNGSSYVFHQITWDGAVNFSAASGAGSIINFGSRANSYGFGIQAGKGSSINHIKVIGAFTPPSISSAYSFYNQSIGSYTDGVSRDSRYSPHSAFVVDPYGPSVPADGGWPGNDAYGVSLSTYYRGGTSGSTGIEFINCYASKWVVGLITSPNGQTVNAELLYANGMQFENYKWCVAGCQAQEKGNVIEVVEAWGEGYGIFCNNIYGANSAGGWTFRDWNIAGFNVLFASYNDSGFIPSFFQNIFAESIGSLGSMKTDQGAMFQNCTWHFAGNVEAQSYTMAHVNTPGFVHFGGSMCMYGTFNPITIDGTIGASFYQNVSFEAVPFFTTGYSRGNCSFKNCPVGGDLINPDDMQTPLSSGFSDTFAYGYGKVNSGGRVYTMESSYPAMPMPINRVLANYVVTITVVGGIRQSVITCPADESNRVQVGDKIVASTTPGGPLKMLGLVAEAPGGTMTVNYIPSWPVSGNSYYLYVWLPMYNVSFTGDIASGSNQIINVVVKDGSPVPVISLGGLMFTKSIPITDSFNSSMVRMISYNSGTGIIVMDKQAAANATKLLITNTDAKPAPGIPSIVAGAAAGGSPTVSITKGKDNSMQVSLTQGTTPLTGILATVSFSLPFPGGYIPSIKFSPANGNAAALSGATQVWMDAANTNSFTINTGSSALSNGTTYIWNIEAN